MMLCNVNEEFSINIYIIIVGSTAWQPMHCFAPPATAVTGKFVHERSHSDTPTPLPVPVDLSAESRLVLKTFNSIYIT